MQILGFRCRYITGSVSQAAREADLSIVASGSATLQVAAAGCPMVIMYQSSRLLWHLVGRWLVRTKYLSLVNILAKRELVPEFMPYFSSVEPIVSIAEALLGDSEKLSRLSGELVDLIGPLRTQNASEQIAQIALDMLFYSK
jgi:lipid-A-disaccharide synthase